MSKYENSMQPKISYDTVEWVSKLAHVPISRGFEKALVIILNDYEHLKKKHPKGGKKN